MTRFEYNALYKALEAYTDAWEAYVADVEADRQSRYGAGALVTDRKEALIELLRRLIEQAA